MHRFHINLTIPQLEGRIARDCCQRRRAPGYFGKDYRAILFVLKNFKTKLWIGDRPGFIGGYFRFFRYEMRPCGQATTVEGTFVFPIYTRCFPMLCALLWIGFLGFHDWRMLTNIPFLLCIGGLFGFSCLVDYGMRKWFPSKATKKQMESEILNYFSELEQAYPVP